MELLTVRELTAPPVDCREVLRYAGARGMLPEVEALLEACMEEALPLYRYRVSYREISLPLTVFAPHDRAAAERRLTGCSRAVIFAATVGLDADRLIARYSRVAPAKALLLDALGSERIEALCDALCAELADVATVQGCVALPRFSPGYGDFSIGAQRELIALLDAPRQIGLTLNDSLLMSPTKSVTAVVGFCEK